MSSSNPASTSKNVPPPSSPPVPFSDLPLDRSSPDLYFNAWGLYGEDDERGFLNRQTDGMVKMAAEGEIRSGKRISLNLPLDIQSQRHHTPLFSRQPFHQNLYQKPPRIVHDDIWTLNTQSSSQWDGLRHFGYQRAARFYNNTPLTSIGDPSNKTLGIQNLASHGIVGRGVLIDFPRWLALQHPSHEAMQTYHSFKSSAIKLEWLISALESQNNTQLRYGDILLLRTGFTKTYLSLPSSELEPLARQAPPNLGGVEQSPALLRWIWDHFLAVAGDQPSWERWPPPSLDPSLSDREKDGFEPWSFHEVLLAGWGCPIGELFDLEGLAGECERAGRWAFFFVSEGCDVPGGVATPPNALAIF